MSLREIRNNEGKDVSIVITGESGSGKTVAAKMIVDYYAACSSEVGKGKIIEQRIPEIGVIMEYFGNAQTQMSINSSRYSKVTSIYFDSSSRLVGASQEFYMLEKSRVTSREASERNYHCFYAILTGMSPEEKKKYHLKDVDFYKITRIHKKSHLHDMIDDNAKYRAYTMSLSILGHKPEVIDFYNRVLSAILWLGNIEYVEVSENSVKIGNRDVVKISAEMLGLDVESLEDVLINKIINIESKSEVTRSPYNMEQATVFRDIFIRTIYNELFSVVVKNINLLTLPNHDYKHCIKLCDAFGFESLEFNSLEQLCINHANEKLHSNYMDVVIKNELRVFREEKLGELDISVQENTQYMNLMQEKSTGFFPKIDEQCRFPNSTDIKLLNMIKEYHQNNPYFEVPVGSNSTFVINHYAKKVVYNIIGFIEKSKIKIHDGILNLVKMSKLPSMCMFFSPDDNIKVKDNSIGYRFCKQLDSLIEMLGKTTVMYVKCIRSNSTFTKDYFDDNVLYSQLISNGIVQALKVRKQILPVKIYYKDVYAKYYMLLDYDNREDPYSDPIETTKKIFKVAGISSCMFGRTLSLLDSASSAMLDDVKVRIINKAAVVFQKNFKAHASRKKFVRKRRAALVIESAALGMLARRHVAQMHYRATVIQSKWRGILARMHYSKMIEMKEQEAREKLRLLSNIEKQKAINEAKISKKSVTQSVPKITTASLPVNKSHYVAPLTPESTESQASNNNNDKGAAKLAEISNDILSTISSALDSARSSDTIFRSFTLRSRSLTLGLNNSKSTLGEILSVDLSLIDINSEQNQLYNYAKDHVCYERKTDHHGIKDLIFKNKRSFLDVESQILTPNDVCDNFYCMGHVYKVFTV